MRIVSLRASGLQMASAGVAKRKQFTWTWWALAMGVAPCRGKGRLVDLVGACDGLSLFASASAVATLYSYNSISK